MTDFVNSPTASAAVEDIGWRVLLGVLCCQVPVDSLDQALAVATAARFAAGEQADQLWLDLRPREVRLSLQDRAADRLRPGHLDAARAISDALLQLGVVTGWHGPHHAVQQWEIAIDTLDLTAILPFWRAVLAYQDAPGQAGVPDALVDPAGAGPTLWFQQLDQARPQRNRIHFDLSVPHDEAPARIEAALAAGGRLVSDAAARAFWILADADGNEVCVCTWQDRD